MRKKSFWIVLALAFPLWTQAQTDTAPARPANRGFGRILEKVAGATSGALSNEEIARGLKEALRIGISKGADQASAIDGYFGNALIRLAMPPEAQRVETRLRQLGMGKQVDQFILALNRSAEDAAKQAKPIFLTALTQMTIQDAVGILRGQPNAATQYLRRTTTPQLVKAFSPIIDSTLQKNSATRYYSDLVTTYNRLPLVTQKVNPNLTQYATDKAIDGLFKLVEEEEKRIRQDPAARVTDLLRRVFGGQ